MRWPTKPTPQVGDVRFTRHFAVCAVECRNGVTIWLEWYRCYEQYTLGSRPSHFGPLYGKYWKHMWNLPGRTL